MPLIEQVKAICDRLAPLGWQDLLKSVTNNALEISQPSTAALHSALTSSIPHIDRTKRGFEDFHPSAMKAITDGQPAQSLLYHAFASPQVHPTSTGEAISSTNYPTLEELDVIENYIYSLVAHRTDIADTVVAVFAYQYREASRTSHLRFADLAYSRTGVARVGTADPNYDASRRSFIPLSQDGTDSLAVLPARYGVFLAIRANAGPSGSVQGGHSVTGEGKFIFPVHKLFNGDECLAGKNLDVQFLEFHRNEKLRKTHRLLESDGGLPVPDGFDISASPYVRDSKNGGNLATIQSVGSSILIVPTPSSSLVRTVSQNNTTTNTIQTVYFNVPKTRTVRERETRFATSTLEIPAFDEDRLSPEYVNIRHQINPSGPATQKPTDLNTLKEADFMRAMAEGGYPAAHFTDDSCDGCVEALVNGFNASIENILGFSLVTAPDFFPLADQLEVENDPTINRVEPLSKGRLPVNPSLPRPSKPSEFAFDRSDKTVTAVVGGFASGPQTPKTDYLKRMVSFLPDAASNVFAPGWDTSRSRDAIGPFLTSSGLGSPFPEDAKLCAALASFWPSVAPDNGRTFGNAGFGNQLPMLDNELGFHPKHSRVMSGEVKSFRGWDGEFGPFFEKDGVKQYVNYVAIERSDYVANALQGQIRVSLTAEVQSKELIARHQALNGCMSVLRRSVNNPQLCLVVVQKVSDWATFGRGSSELQGSGYLLEFAELKETEIKLPDVRRVRHEVLLHHVCQFGINGIAYKRGDGPFKFIPH